MTAPALQRNENVTCSAFTQKVASGVGLVFTAIDLTNYSAFGARAKPSLSTCAGIELLAAGTLSFKDPWGNVVTYTSMTAGYKPIEAATIETGTNVDVIVYF